MRARVLREELKYVLPTSALPALRKAIEPFTEPDPHGRGYEEIGYTVRSIYLDSPNLLYYHEKQAHLQHRKKLRIRGYNLPTDEDIVFLEIKRKHTTRVEKDRAAVRRVDLGVMFETGRYAEYLCASTHAGIDAGRRFFFHLYKEHLRPTSLVAYEREAFKGCFDASFRVTFDRDVRGALYPELDGLFAEDDMRPAMPGYFIMEVKFATRMPAWMGQVIAEFGLMQQAASKYCMCLDLFDRRMDMKSAVLARAPELAWHGDAEIRKIT